MTCVIYMALTANFEGVATTYGGIYSQFFCSLSIPTWNIYVMPLYRNYFIGSCCKGDKEMWRIAMFHLAVW